MASKPLEGSGSTLQSTFELFAHQLIDPVSKDWMTDAVSLTHCGHTLSQRTADACLERGLPCPIGDPHRISPYAPSLAIRQIIELFRTVNTSPVTLKERITTLPIYLGDAGTVAPFTPCGEKSGGTAIGTIYSYAEGRQESQWLGKVGQPTGLLRNERDTYRKRTRKDMNLDTIKEKIAFDCYTILGRQRYETPRTCLSRQPIMDDFTIGNVLAQSLASIVNSLRIMSRLVEEYHDFDHATTLHQGRSIPFMDYIREEKRPPDKIYTSAGTLVPLAGFIELIAVGRAIADTDVLGGYGGNAGFVWIKNDRGVITSARTIKIDPGCAFQFLHAPTDDGTFNITYDTLKRLGNQRHWQTDTRDIQIANNDRSTDIVWERLTQEQKNRFLNTLAATLKTVTRPEDLHFLFFREGAFDRSDEEKIPEDIAALYVTKMQEWLTHQQQIYSRELMQYKTNLPKDLPQSIHDIVLEKERLLMAANTSSARQAEQLRAEAEIRLQAQAEASRVEIERLRQQLREAENALSQVLAAPRDIPGSPPPASSKEAAAPSPIVSKGGKAPVIQKGQLEGLETYAFGKAKWETYFGDIGEEPPLPHDIHEILAGRCPFDSKKTVRETHMLVLVPATVGGVPLTLNLLGELVKKPKGGGHATQYRDVWQDLFDQYGAVPCQESHWVLMSRDVLPGTRKKSFRDQCAILAGFGDFRAPTLLEAAVCIFMEHVATGNRLYGDNPWTCTRCVEECEETAIGGFSAGGLYVRNGIYVDENFGLALLWKFRH